MLFNHPQCLQCVILRYGRVFVHKIVHYTNIAELKILPDFKTMESFTNVNILKNNNNKSDAMILQC